MQGRKRSTLFAISTWVSFRCPSCSVGGCCIILSAPSLHERHGLSSVSMWKVSPNPQYMGREARGVPAPRLCLKGVLQVCRGVPSPALQGGDHLFPRLSEDKGELQRNPQEDKKVAQGMARQSQTQLPGALAQHIKLEDSLCLSSN